MADNNKNPRRTIWLSEIEPLSHYDIWLSKNQHLNSDGEPISTSGVLRPCDYIFKVWDCDNWYPIVGLNSTALNKIDTVWNTNGYTDSLGTFHTGQYDEFNVPLFTRQGNSPAELFNGGTIGLVIQNYVTEEEWQLIFEGDVFGGNNIINENIDPAGQEYLGGIWADTFSIEDMFPDSEAHDSHSQTEINDSYNWIALAKYKLNHGTSDYNLYVSAKDIIGAINNYITNNPEAPGIQPSNDFELLLAEEYKIGGIRAKVLDKPDDTHLIEVGFKNRTDDTLEDYGRLFVKAQDVVGEGIELATPDEIGGIKAHTFDDEIENLVEVKFTNDPNNRPYGFLYVNPAEITENSFNDPGFISDLLWLAFENSPSIKKDWDYPYEPSSAQKPRFSLYGTGDPAKNGGKFLRLKTADEIQNINFPYIDSNNYLDWVDISDFLGIEGGTAIEIDNTNLQNKKINLKYSNESFNVVNSNNELLLKPATPLTLGGVIVGSGLNISNSGVLSADSQEIPEQLSIVAGTGILVTPSDNTRTISIKTDGSEGLFLSIIDSNTVGWKTISPSTPTTYTGDIGIVVDDTDDTIKIDVGTGNNNRYLRVNGDGDDVIWDTVQLEEYLAGDGIEIDTTTTPNTINAKISYGDNTNSNTFIVDLTLSIRTSSESGKNIIVVSHDNDLQEDSLKVNPFTYLNIPFSNTPSNTLGEITFSVSLQTTIMDGDPIYFILSVPKGGYSSIEIIVEDTYQTSISDYIYLNDCVQENNGHNYLNMISGGINCKYLVTVLFGIVKIEPLGVITTQSNPA